MRFNTLQDYAKERGISVYPDDAWTEYRYKITIPVFGPDAAAGRPAGFRVKKANTLKEAQAIIDGRWSDPEFQAAVKRMKMR